MMKHSRRILVGLLILASLSSAWTPTPTPVSAAEKLPELQAKYIFLFIGDGMGWLTALQQNFSLPYSRIPPLEAGKIKSC